MAFSFSSVLCTGLKLHVLTSILILGMVGYAFVEYITRLEAKLEQEKEEKCVSLQGKDKMVKCVIHKEIGKEVSKLETEKMIES